MYLQKITHESSGTFFVICDPWCGKKIRIERSSVEAWDALSVYRIRHHAGVLSTRSSVSPPDERGVGQEGDACHVGLAGRPMEDEGRDDGEDDQTDDGCRIEQRRVDQTQRVQNDHDRRDELERDGADDGVAARRSPLALSSALTVDWNAIVLLSPDRKNMSTRAMTAAARMCVSALSQE